MMFLVLNIDGAKVQCKLLRDLACPEIDTNRTIEIIVLDLPGIIEGASDGRGRGRQVIAVAKTAELVLIMVDATKDDSQRRKLEIELEAVGIRLNRKRPDVVFKQKVIFFFPFYHF